MQTRKKKRGGKKTVFFLAVVVVALVNLFTFLVYNPKRLLKKRTNKTQKIDNRRKKVVLNPPPTRPPAILAMIPLHPSVKKQQESVQSPQFIPIKEKRRPTKTVIIRKKRRKERAKIRKGSNFYISLSRFGVPRKTKLAILKALGQITLLDSNLDGDYFELSRGGNGNITQVKFHKQSGQVYLVRKKRHNFKATRLK